MTFDQAKLYASNGYTLLLPGWKGYFNWDYRNKELIFKDRDYILEERWWGYEDNYFLFTVDRQETSDEIVARICSKVESNCRAFLEKDKQIAEIDKEIRRLQNKKSELVK